VHKKHTGIVVKRYFPQKQKIVLFDDEWGKITCVPPHDRISLGTLLSYEIQQRNGMPFIYDVELIAMPLDGGEMDILFVHHVLEVCYYFIPEQSIASEVYDMMMLLFTKQPCIRHPFFKKIFLFKLFVLLGIYPDRAVPLDALEHTLLINPLELLIRGDSTTQLERRLTKWLRDCMIMHPCIEYFKTVHFLDENRVV
jgi:hypothetical protein